MPYPYKQILYAHEQFIDRSKLSVAVPDLLDFANYLSDYISRNSLISTVKRLLLMRGVRCSVDIGKACEQKDKYLSFYCARCKKESEKGTDVKDDCSFALFFERKSCLLEPGLGPKGVKQDLGFRANVMEDGPIMKDEEEPQNYFDAGLSFSQQFINDERRKREFIFDDDENPWSFGPWRDIQRYGLQDDSILPGNPYYLVKYRAFHNHEIDTHLMIFHHFITEWDLWNKNAWKVLPQDSVAL